MDGSAQPFVEIIQGAGIRHLDEPRKFIRITREVSVSQGEAQATLKPYDGFRASYTFVADHPVFNRYPKSIEVDFASTSYLQDVCGARSFGLMRELDQARAIRKCLGSSLDNAVGIGDDENRQHRGLALRRRVRQAQAARRHRRPVPARLAGHRGNSMGYMSGHTLNNKLARALLRCPDAWVLQALPTTHRQRAYSLH